MSEEKKYRTNDKLAKMRMWVSNIFADNEQKIRRWNVLYRYHDFAIVIMLLYCCMRWLDIQIARSRCFSWIGCSVSKLGGGDDDGGIKSRY